MVWLKLNYIDFYNYFEILLKAMHLLELFNKDIYSVNIFQINLFVDKNLLVIILCKSEGWKSKYRFKYLMNINFYVPSVIIKQFNKAW